MLGMSQHTLAGVLKGQALTARLAMAAGYERVVLYRPVGKDLETAVAEATFARIAGRRNAAWDAWLVRATGGGDAGTEGTAAGIEGSVDVGVEAGDQAGGAGPRAGAD